MATPAEKIKRLRLDSDNPFPDAYKTPTETLKGGPLAEALRAKRARQTARSEQTSGRPKESAMGSMKNVDAGTGRGDTGGAKTGGGKSFKDAFAEARKSGKDTFNWNGKKYTTEMAGSKPKTADRTLEEAHQESIGTGAAEKEYDATPYVEAHDEATRFKKGGSVKMAKGGSASSRADGCAQRGKTKGRMV
jgi:hypothetical protein